MPGSCWGADRELLVPDADRRALWTSRVWPGALLVGETCRHLAACGGHVTLQPWRRLSSAERAAVEAEAASLPLPGAMGRIVIAWED